MKPVNQFYRRLKWTALAGLCFSLYSCGPDPFPNDPHDPDIYTLDSMIFFRINLDGIDYNSYGIKTLGEPTNSPLLRGSYYVRIIDTLQGTPANNKKLTSFCLGSLGNALIAPTGLPKNKLDFQVLAQTNSNLIGTYLLKDTPTIKLLEENLIYRVDLTKNYHYRIDAIDSLYISGSFNFNLLEYGTNRSLPAYGNFRLNNLNP